MATDGEERSGLKFENVGPTFSSLTVLHGGKSLKNYRLWFAHIRESEFMPFLSLKGYSVDQ